jgi:ferric-dicitrate binding protein FerR (iron transport regulator)
LAEINDILNFLEGKLSDKEKLTVQSWIDSSKENQKELEFYKSILKESRNLNEIVLVDEIDSWKEFENLAGIKSSNSGFRNRIYYGIAASVILIAATLSFLFWPEPLYQELTTLSNQDTVKLVDGSSIFVNDSSKVKYYTRLTKKQTERYIEISGSATFDIAPDKNLPFVVKANGAGVSVLGTIFNVKVNGERIECENIDGVVKLFEWVKPDNNLILNKGEKAVFENGMISMILPEPPPPPPVSAGRLMSVESIIEYMFDHFVELVNTAPYSDIKMEDRVFVNLRQPLKGIIEQLDTTANIRFRQNCTGCYEFTRFKSK